MTILTILTVGTLCIVCFFIGAKIGQTSARGEDIKLPQNPIDAVRERQETRQARREAAQEADKLDAILENIKNYNGTGNGQRDIPRG